MAFVGSVAGVGLGSSSSMGAAAAVAVSGKPRVVESKAAVRMQVPNSPSELFRQNRGGGIGNPGLQTQSTGTAVLERPVEKVPQTGQTDPGAFYKVILFGDKSHPKQYIVKTVMNVIPGMTFDSATAKVEEALKTGTSVVGVWIFEQAEMYCDLLRSAGLKCDLREA
ncbi:ATP-dependent Clp protease adapter protein CLPS1, chloroplastic [Porphyridium purpureum]|uniref:ATP-dependent Clp protease adapter protein CLPS1, chloroplastic n=1 Tax=Porphyridium purpureum TaxID=35688 RepID=A0A5J4YVI2_PORPP|nr:ATP-dependent Clp protease adapter protein CLPS1, chloroplastic [Porphyridium purpureum]|eukprot:POR0384..scf227_4